MSNIFANFYFESSTMAELGDLEKLLFDAKVTDEKEKREENILSFENRGLKLETEKDAEAVVTEIDNANVVHGIIFKGNTIGAAPAKKIGEALAKRKEFKRALWSDMFTGRSKTEIPPALLDLCGGIRTAGARLVELDLSDNAFGPNGARGIEDFLRSSSAYSLEILKLNNNGLGITGGKMIAEALKDCYRSSFAAGTPLKLRIFVGGRNRLENEGATALAESFKLIGTLEEVTMPQNGIYHVGIAALANAFAHNPAMRLINLSDNTFTEKGATLIANVLHSMKDLQVINFGDCLLKAQGGLILANSLKNSCEKLQELVLSGNELDTSAGLAVVASMSNKKNIKVLELDANCFGAGGIRDITNLAKELKLSSVLGSFDDDEEVGSDVENGDEQEQENESDHEASEIDLSGLSSSAKSEVNGIAVNGSGDGDARSPLNLVTEKFYVHPDAASLIALAESLPEQMSKLLHESLRNPDDVVGFMFGVASLINDSSSDYVKQLAQKCCDTSLKGAFEAKGSAQVTNDILEHLGVIKSENNLKEPSNIGGVLSMLSATVKNDWFPVESRSLLAFFLEKKKAKLHADEGALTALMEGLALK